ncbi:multiheme c-type cytochrome [Xanthobacter sp. KR7-65]|uniref:multiheme c-type cytochrome n=1 Tax=Xanthobacter sp. KR7-65 TaxID=3156612 RepID=UPI0032B45210
MSATKSYAVSALYATLANLRTASSPIRWVNTAFARWAGREKMPTAGVGPWRLTVLAAGLAALAAMPARAQTPETKMPSPGIAQPAGLDKGAGAPAAGADHPSSARSGGTADHCKFKILQQDFKSGEEVTKACLTCHTEAAKQVMGSIHWTWHFKNPKTGQELGKSEVINSFCGNVASNEPRCTSCHAGYGWEKMADGPPRSETAVDCLVCHAEPGRYAKLDNEAGRPALGRVDEFDQAEACGETDDGSEVSSRLFAA